CETCHDELHSLSEPEKASLKLQKRGKARTTDANQASTISMYLKKSLNCKETFGYETKYKRELLGFKKEHYIDAICVALHDGETIQLPSHIYKKVSIPRGDYQQTSGARSEQPLPTHKIMGFRKYDKVLWNNQESFIKGRMSTGYAILMDIEGKKIPFKPIPKLKTMKRISARKSCLTALMNIENLPSNITLSSSANIEKSCLKKKNLVHA
ncbi:MAG: HNH endonuclease, partial [Chlamydiae bacterium]|nr:HNH endonuclease [Chlamydiota bacterium]